ncbi:hypothetical protein JL720_15947 [Aureococcus anophagefferens]|nr:hypothetical protein JL720_15947 [Aureococcus anophagefferens]
MASLLAANALENFEELGASDDDSESDDGSPRCRICYETGGVLLRPCACDGSMAFVHGACPGGGSPRRRPRVADLRRLPEPVAGRLGADGRPLPPVLVFGGRGADAVARLLRHSQLWSPRSPEGILSTAGRTIGDIVAAAGNHRETHDQMPRCGGPGAALAPWQANVVPVDADKPRGTPVVTALGSGSLTDTGCFADGSPGSKRRH